MTTLIEYYVFCFDRYLNVTVNESDKLRAEHIIDAVYDTWQELDTDQGCEEFICHCLQEQDIPFEAERFQYETFFDYFLKKCHQSQTKCQICGYALY